MTLDAAGWTADGFAPPRVTSVSGSAGNREMRGIELANELFGAAQ